MNKQNIMSINGSAIEYFINVYELKSITEAAKVSGTTQSSVTKIMKGLEAKLDVVLFDRSTRNLAPTQAADYLYAKFQDLYREFLSLERLTQKVHDGNYGALSIGIGKLVSPIISQALCIGLPVNNENNDDVKVSIISGTFMNLNRKLLQGEIDFFISQSELLPNIPELDLLAKTPFLSLETACIKSPAIHKQDDITNYKWAFPQFDTHHIASRLNNPLIQEFYQRVKAKGNIAYQVDSNEVRVQIAESGQAATLVPLFMVEEKIHAGQLERISSNVDFFDFSIYHLASRPLNDSIRKLIKTLKSSLIQDFHFSDIRT
ncbi:LysR family transcriptional regulator [Vibrio sp. S4M6]|uniref:LysR family transcriptional regulator n=1 Tax=Vibrio sinus TaxID=2946865 RepID=UPI00202A18B3|nr:LysR family transcriptional regulator [Vibrio sinus]MCL9781734.1 LysR family transcriptional regulator [Vibrio sinus]